MATAARAAFLEGMQSALLVLAVVIAVSSVLIGRWAPERDGRQLTIVERLRTRRRSTSKHRR